LLSASARAHLENPDNQLILSVVSLWEMQIKLAIGKLPLRLPLADLVLEQTEQNGYKSCPSPCRTF
jgi:PIN domain nuclease of toxin-antitoxin system